MKFRLLYSISLFLCGCNLHEEDNYPDISGTYVLQVRSRYGITSDTLLVVRKAGATTYNVTHKVEFVRNAHDLQHNRIYRIEEHIAIFEKHASTLQDIDDGTIFLVNYRNQNYRKEDGIYQKAN